MSARINQFGLKQTQCPADCAVLACYTECEHTNFVFSENYPLFNGTDYVASLLKGVLKVHEETIASFCEPWDICKIGDFLHFPCVQCGFVAQSGFKICDDVISCDGVEYKIIDPCYEICADDLCGQCITAEVDFLATGEGTALYETIINAIQSFTGAANWLGLDEFAKLIFGAGAEVVTFQAGIYYISAGRVLTDFEKRSLNIILSAFPVPLGAVVKLVEAL